LILIIDIKHLDGMTIVKFMWLRAC
jgi:hypothetical protein